MTRIIDISLHDVRFSTSDSHRGSDAMHTDPDYSAAYVTLITDSDVEGCGFAFTLGRGTELCVAGIRALAPAVVGRDLASITSEMRAFWRQLTSDTQLRWLGPEKGVIHLATAALVNAVWDLYAKTERKPLWRLLAEMPPAELVAALDFRYVTDALRPEEALDILTDLESTRNARAAELAEHGLPAYTTSAGWLGYSDEKVRALTRAGVEDGWSNFKMKVGDNLADDLRRAEIMREQIGWDRRLMFDANQRWDVEEAIKNTNALRDLDPWWMEEPTSPDDVLGHAAIAREVAPILVATGEHVQNRVVFKQLLQAGAIGICQIDSCRLGGVNEVVLVMLLATKYGVPVCPHAGGVGLCELVQHLSAFDYICVSGSLNDRVVEYVDELHEHFVDPVRIVNGRYRLPEQPGYSTTMRPESLQKHAFPYGAAWQGGKQTRMKEGTLA